MTTPELHAAQDALDKRIDTMLEALTIAPWPRVVREESFGVIRMRLLQLERGGLELRIDTGDNINVWIDYPRNDYPSQMQQLALACARVDGSFAVVAKDDRARDTRLATAIDKLTAVVELSLKEKP